MNFYEKQARKLERYSELAEKRKLESQQAWNQADKISDAIPFGQPILIGHHSEKRHRRDLDKIDRLSHKAIELNDKADYYENKADNIVNPKGISSDDPEAISKLKAEIAELEKQREETKKIPIIERDYSFSKEDMRSVNLQSLTANIRRLQKRIEELNAVQQIPDDDKIINGVTLSIDKIDNRVKLFFPSIPSEQIRTELKRNGFHWSPSNQAWQRMISNQALYIAEKILNEN